MAIEMTIVMPPFVVDFASASLDVSIEFSEEIWADWERTKQEQFGLQWETVQAILIELSHMLDPSPSNIRCVCGGCLPRCASSSRIAKASGRFMCSAMTVARPVGVIPTTRTPSQRKCSRHASRRESGYCQPQCYD